MSNNAKWSDFVSLDGPRTVAAANQLLPFWVSLLLVIVVGWQLARIGWALAPGAAAGDAVAIPAGAAIQRGDTGSGFDAEAIAAVHLFGEASEEPIEETTGPAGPAPTVVGETDKNLTLTGIVAATVPEMSAALIEDASREERAYQIGDTVMAGAILHSVEADHVVLNENGTYTSLTLPDEFADRPSPVRRTPRVVQRAPANNQSIQSVVAQNVSRLADVIRPTPYFVNGQQQGYRVYPGRNRQQFAALGLRPGDLIKDIDGQALNDPTQAMKIFQSLGSAEQVSVTVERDGQPQALVLRTSQLDLSGQDTE